MMYRIFEYDSQIALQSSEILEDKLIVKFPNTAVLYLRHNKRTPEKMTMEIRVPGATCSYPVPILKVQNYTIEEIFAKDIENCVNDNPYLEGYIIEEWME